jgi:hypothetical protein
MVCDYGFRAGAGRLYQDRYGEVPGGILDMVGMQGLVGCGRLRCGGAGAAGQGRAGQAGHGTARHGRDPKGKARLGQGKQTGAAIGSGARHGALRAAGAYHACGPGPALCVSPAARAAMGLSAAACTAPARHGLRGTAMLAVQGPGSVATSTTYAWAACSWPLHCMWASWQNVRALDCAFSLLPGCPGTADPSKPPRRQPTHAPRLLLTSSTSWQPCAAPSASTSTTLCWRPPPAARLQRCGAAQR